MKLDLSIILLALFNFLYLLNCANFTPELPTNATNFEIVLMKSSNLIGVYYSISASNHQIRVYNIANHSLQNTVLLSSYPDMRFLQSIPNTQYISFIDYEDPYQIVQVIDASTGLKYYQNYFNSTSMVTIEQQQNINNITFAITYFKDNITHLEEYYFGNYIPVLRTTDQNITDVYSMIANDSTIIYIGKNQYSKTIDLKCYYARTQQLKILYQDKSLASFYYLTGIKLFNINANLIGLNLINSTVLIFNSTNGNLVVNEITLNFSNFGYCISVGNLSNPTMACFGIQSQKNTIILYDIQQKSVINSLTETEIIYQIIVESNNTIAYVTPTYLKEWKFQGSIE